MLRLLCLLSVMVAMGQAKPVDDQNLVASLARHYAALHPNTETERDPEEGDYFQGDILERETDDAPETNPLNAIPNSNRYWPNGVSYYTIQSGAYTASEISRIEAGIAEIQRLTMVNGQYCIRILPRTNQGDYVRIENYSGCSSYVGRSGGAQRMSLVPSCLATTRPATVMHEWLHAFGFYHEQSRTDRDDYVTINWSNIQPGTENNFVKYSSSQINMLGTRYDYGGAMHYGAYGFAIDPNVPTIIPHDPNAQIGQRATLSALDIERVQILYNCKRAEDSVYFKHLTREDLMKYNIPTIH